MPTIADIINSTPELKKKLATNIVVQVGQRFFVINPTDAGLHSFTEGKMKGQVFMTYQALETVDAKGNAFVPQTRAPRKAKDGK